MLHGRSANGSVLLLATRYHDWAPTRDDVQRSFIDAYSELTALTDAERSELARRIDAVLGEMGWARPT